MTSYMLVAPCKSKREAQLCIDEALDLVSVLPENSLSYFQWTIIVVKFATDSIDGSRGPDLGILACRLKLGRLFFVLLTRRRLFRLASRPHLWDFRYPVRPTNHTICKRIILKILKHFNKRINKRCEGRMEASRSLSGESLVTVSAWRLTKRFDVSYWFYNWLTKNTKAITNFTVVHNV